MTRISTICTFIVIPADTAMADTDTFTVSGLTSAELKIKGSLFIGTLCGVADKEQAEITLTELRARNKDATHNCFAYRIDKDIFRYYDDGEPSSTAGKPILSMLDKYQLRQVVLVVTRYYGGTKLGVGGLIQAYGGCAEATIQQADLRRIVSYVSLKVVYPYRLERHFHYLLGRFQVSVQQTEYSENIQAVVVLPQDAKAGFVEAFQGSNGDVHISEVLP